MRVECEAIAHYAFYGHSAKPGMSSFLFTTMERFESPTFFRIPTSGKNPQQNGKKAAISERNPSVIPLLKSYRRVGN
jgi:hypothetical protein